MKDLLDKIGSYNIFNYLFPGAILAYFIDTFTTLHVAPKDPVTGAFVYYFLGSIVSRVGSIIVEPFLKKCGFVKFASYTEFIQAEKADAKIAVLNETNNMYRTICALMAVIGLLAAYEFCAGRCQWLKEAGEITIVPAILILYLFSYRKQTEYIAKRIEGAKL